MKKILLFITLFTATLSWSQFEIISIDSDNDMFCDGDFKTYLIKVKHPVFNIPSLPVSPYPSTQGYLNIASTNPLTNIGGDTSEFYIDIYMNMQVLL